MLPAGDRLHEGQPQPTWSGAGSGAGEARGACPRSSPGCCISSLSLGSSPEPVSWDGASSAEREGLGDRGCWSPHTSHLPTLALRTRSLLLLAGTGPSWLSDPRPGSQELPLSITPVHLDTHLWPLGLFLNLVVLPQGSEWLAGLRGHSSSAQRAPPSWDPCKPGPPKSQGARRTSQEESQMGDPPSPKASPSTSKVRPNLGRS